MSQYVFKHKVPQIEFSLHAYLEEPGGEALCYNYVMGSRYPIAHNDLVKNRLFGSEMWGGKVVLIRPCSDLFSSYWETIGSVSSTSISSSRMLAPRSFRNSDLQGSPCPWRDLHRTLG